MQSDARRFFGSNVGWPGHRALIAEDAMTAKQTTQSMVQDMIAVAVACAARPGHVSVWSERLGKYICAKDPAFKEAAANQTPEIVAAHPAINPTFKLVFLTAAIGTALFTMLCVLIHVFTKQPLPSLTDKLFDALLSMAQIGFGAIVGLLGGRSIHGAK
jgi:hypothetical protein